MVDIVQGLPRRPSCPMTRVRAVPSGGKRGDLRKPLDRICQVRVTNGSRDTTVPPHLSVSKPHKYMESTAAFPRGYTPSGASPHTEEFSVILIKIPRIFLWNLTSSF